MILYHGSNVEVRVPRLLAQARAMDFGAAFYLTSDFDQAARWARTKTLRLGEGEPVVSVFDFDETGESPLRILKFDAPDIPWLRFVALSRVQRIEDAEHDVVAGPVANDNSQPVLDLYFKGAYTEEEAFRRLQAQRLKDQYAFKTAAALARLKFREAKRI